MASSGLEVRITYTSVFVRAEENCEHIFRPNQEMEVTVVVNVGEDAAVGDINGAITNDDDLTRVKLTSTRNGSLTIPLESGLEITFHVDVSGEKEKNESCIQESGEHSEKSCLVHSGTYFKN